MRCAIDTGGTFTDLALDHDGEIRIFKAPTTPANPIEGILDVLGRAAEALGLERAELLGQVEMLVHGTTRATNAVLTGNTARTALLTTLGHPDVLLLREGGRNRPFDWSQSYQDPYIPRALTFEVPERVDAQGRVLRELDEGAVVEIVERMRGLEVEAVAVCLLWSIVNPVHEQRVSELLEEHLPGIPYTLSHALNPTLREYRRASSTAIDASLKPLMTDYIGNLDESLKKAGFGGDLLLRRLRRPRRTHPDEPRNLARGTAGGPHHRLPGRRRQEHRRRRRQHRLDRRRWPAPRRPAERRRRPRPGRLRPWRREADRHRRLPGARLPRSRPLSRRDDEA